jgi:hypothetical protein
MSDTTYFLIQVHGNGYVKTSDVHSAALLLSYRRPLWRMCKEWEYEQRRRDDLALQLDYTYDATFDDSGDTEPIEAVNDGN